MTYITSWKRCINPECWRLFEFDRILNKSDRLCPGCYRGKYNESAFNEPKKYSLPENKPPKPPKGRERLARALDEMIGEGKPFFLTQLANRAGVARTYLDKKELKEFKLKAIAASNELMARQVGKTNLPKLPDDPVKVAIEQELQQPLNNIDYYTAQLSLEEKRWANLTTVKSKAS